MYLPTMLTYFAETFDSERWLAPIPARRDDLRIFAESLAGHADEEGLVEASNGFLKRGLEIKGSKADLAVKRLREAGLLEIHRRGDTVKRTPTVWRLRYAASPVYTTTIPEVPTIHHGEG